MASGEPLECDEVVYYAVDPSKIFNRMVDFSAVRYPNTSVNRAMTSQPRSVCIGDRSGWEPWKIIVNDMPGPFDFVRESKPHKGQTDRYSFRAEHDPEPNNESHCEVRTYRNGPERVHNDPPKRVKAHFRASFAKNLEPA